MVMEFQGREEEDLNKEGMERLGRREEEGRQGRREEEGRLGRGDEEGRLGQRDRVASILVKIYTSHVHENR